MQLELYVIEISENAKFNTSKKLNNNSKLKLYLRTVFLLYALKVR